MKKYTAMILATVMAAGLLTGCGMLDEILEDDPSEAVELIDEDDEKLLKAFESRVKEGESYEY
jgi:hypothetical protein